MMDWGAWSGHHAGPMGTGAEKAWAGGWGTPRDPSRAQLAQKHWPGSLRRQSLPIS